MELLLNPRLSEAEILRQTKRIADARFDLLKTAIDHAQKMPLEQRTHYLSEVSLLIYSMMPL